jgi:hypothetical protein
MAQERMYATIVMARGGLIRMKIKKLRLEFKDWQIGDIIEARDKSDLYLVKNINYSCKCKCIPESHDTIALSCGNEETKDRKLGWKVENGKIIRNVVRVTP